MFKLEVHVRIDVFLWKNSNGNNLFTIEKCSCHDRILYLRVDAKEIAKYDNLENNFYLLILFTLLLHSNQKLTLGLMFFCKKNSNGNNLFTIEKYFQRHRILYLRVDAKKSAKYDNLRNNSYLLMLFAFSLRSNQKFTLGLTFFCEKIGIEIIFLRSRTVPVMTVYYT